MIVVIIWNENNVYLDNCYLSLLYYLYSETIYIVNLSPLAILTNPTRHDMYRDSSRDIYNQITFGSYYI